MRPRNLLLYCEATLALAAARLGLRLIPLGTLIPRETTGMPMPPTPSTDYGKILRVRDGLARMTPRLPFQCSCLTQALAGQWMLRRRKVASVLHVGVAKPGPEITAHAWLTAGDRVVCGGEESPSFTPIGRFPSPPL